MTYRHDDYPPAPKWELVIYFGLAFLILLLMWLTGCAPKPAPDQFPPRADYCERDVILGVGSVCDAQFTKQGFPCVVCANVSECVDKRTMSYCAQSCMDPICEWRP